MRQLAPPEMRDPATPATVLVFTEAREPTTDPTVGIPVALRPVGGSKHRLVTLGDSLTHGFQSGAIYNTDISYPRIVAWEMGWADSFRYPRYGGPGGLPINIEYAVRHLEERFGDKLDWWELAPATFAVRSLMDEIEDYWERGPGSHLPAVAGINHNLGVYGWDLRDALSRTASVCASALGEPKDDFLDQIVENHNDRAALRVLPRITPGRPGLSMLEAARQLGADGGIETLIVMLGSNNALDTILDLDGLRWTTDADGSKPYQDLVKKKAFNIWDPAHFQIELDALVAEVEAIHAERVIWGTVPHVTVAPVARGVGAKPAGSRYFPFYTRPWIADADFDVSDDPHLTANQARAIDAAIDQYNDAIVAAVRRARQAGRPWFVLDVAGLLDRLASRRYINDPTARPAWWTPYELPPALQALSPLPDSRFFSSGPGGRTQGGLFSLDGLHPTTVGYGVLAQELIHVMQACGVPFFFGDGKTIRSGPVAVDFERLIALDTLISDPPRSFGDDLALLGWLDEKVDFLSRLF